jgi:hypothetical protein
MQFDAYQFGTLNAVNINGGSTKLVLNGTITQTAAVQMNLNFNGATPGAIALNQPLVWRSIVNLSDNYTNKNLGDAAVCINTLELNAPGNSFTNCIVTRGKLRIGADNAFPAACPLNPNSNDTIHNNTDKRLIIDLNGHSQTFSNALAFSIGPPTWIGNDSTNADATVSFDSGSVTNFVGCWICDNLNANLNSPHKTGLTVHSGGLHLGLNATGLRTLTNLNASASGPTNIVYTGPTVVDGGILQVDAPLLGATAVTVSGAGILAGAGSFSTNGSVTINSGGTLSPGGNSNTLASAIGIMTNYGTLTLNPGSKTYLEVKRYYATTNDTFLTTTNDSVRGLGTMVYNGGTLLVTNVGTNAITSSSVFQIFSASSYTLLSAMTLTPTVPGPGLLWDTSQLAVDGTLRVALATPAPPTLTTTVSNGNLTLSWPADHVGWSLQAQTNRLTVGITNNWVTVPGTTNALPYTVPLVSTNPAVFYRLISP